MFELDFAQAMITHEAALVHIAVDTDNTALAGILPHGDVTVVGQHGLLGGIHGYHDFIIVNLSL